MTNETTTGRVGYEVTVVNNESGSTQTTSGGGTTTGAWLRALANEIDPQVDPAPTKPTCRCATSREVEPTGFITTVPKRQR